MGLLATPLGRRDILKEFKLNCNMRHCTLVLLVLAGLGARAQSIPLSGTIAIQNSRYTTGTRQFVNGASVRAPFAKATSSDATGQFRMEFNGVENGTILRFDIAKSGLEVVNTKEIERVVLGRTSALDVVMADPMELADMQAKYYAVAQASVQRSFQRGMVSLRDTTVQLAQRLARFNADMQDSVATLSDALKELAQQRDHAMEQAGTLARDLALVDLDLASDRYRSAHEAMLRGDMDSALVLLDPAELDADMARAVDQRAKGSDMVERSDLAIRQVVGGYGLKAQVLNTRFDNRGALASHQEILRIVRDQDDLFDALDEADALLAVALDLNSGGHRIDAIATMNDALRVARTVRSVAPSVMAGLHLELATILLEASRFTEGVTHADSASVLLSTDDLPAPEQVYQVHMTTASLLNKLGETERAVEHAEQALVVATSMKDARRCARVETVIGHSLLLMDAYDSAYVHAERGLRLGEQLMSPDDPQLAVAYEMVSGILNLQGRYTEALQAERQALAIRSRTMDPTHPLVKHTHAVIGMELKGAGDIESALAEYMICLQEDPAAMGEVTTDLADSHNMVGDLLGELGRFSEAETHLRASVVMEEQLYGVGHQNTGGGYNTLGVNFWRMGMRDSAMVNYRRALEVWKGSIGEENYAVGLLYGNMATVLSQGGDYEQAMAMDRRSLAIIVPLLGKGHPDVANVHQSMGVINTRIDRPDSAVHYLDLAYTTFAATFGASSAQSVITRQSAALYRARAGRGAEALAMAEEGIAAMRKGPDAESLLMVDWHIRLAQILALNKDFKRAIEVHHEVLAMVQRIPAANGRFAFAHATLGKTLYDKGDFDLAATEIDLAIKSAPASYIHWYAHLVALALNDRAKALEDAAASLRLQAKEPSPFVKQREGAFAAVALLARELDRQDLLQEFDLE